MNRTRALPLLSLGLLLLGCPEPEPTRPIVTPSTRDMTEVDMPPEVDMPLKMDMPSEMDMPPDVDMPVDMEPDLPEGITRVELNRPSLELGMLTTLSRTIRVTATAYNAQDEEMPCTIAFEAPDGFGSVASMKVDSDENVLRVKQVSPGVIDAKVGCEEASEVAWHDFGVRVYPYLKELFTPLRLWLRASLFVQNDPNGPFTWTNAVRSQSLEGFVFDAGAGVGLQPPELTTTSEGFDGVSFGGDAALAPQGIVSARLNLEPPMRSAALIFVLDLPENASGTVIGNKDGSDPSRIFLENGILKVAGLVSQEARPAIDVPTKAGVGRYTFRIWKQSVDHQLYLNARHGQDQNAVIQSTIVTADRTWILDQLGMRGQDLETGLNGSILEMIVIDEFVSDEDLFVLENYLDCRYGLRTMCASP